MTRRLPLTIKHIMFNLRGGFLVRPLCIALALGLCGGLLSWMEEAYPGMSLWVPVFLFPSKSDPQVAQVILSNVATSIMTVVSIVFAILLMSLTLASMQFSPRIIVSFSRDKVTQWTLGLFLGTFSYCIAALPAARSLPYAFAPVLTVCGAMLLAVACVVGLLFFIHHISRAISVNYIVDRIASETELAIDELMPEPFDQQLWPIGASTAQKAVVDTPVHSGVAGYICFVDTARMVRLAKRHQIKVTVLKRVDHSVVQESVELGHVAGQEAPVRRDRVAAQGGFAWLGHVFADERQHLRFCVGQRQRRREHRLVEPGAGMHRNDHRVHLLQGLRRSGDHQVDAITQLVQLSVGDDAGHLDEQVSRQVEPGHLAVDPDEAVHRLKVTVA